MIIPSFQNVKYLIFMVAKRKCKGGLEIRIQTAYYIYVYVCAICVDEHKEIKDFNATTLAS